MSRSGQPHKSAQQSGRTDVGGVVRSAENKLRGAVVAGADVADVGLAGDEYFGRAKVAELVLGGRSLENIFNLRSGESARGAG